MHVYIYIHINVTHYLQYMLCICICIYIGDKPGSFRLAWTSPKRPCQAECARHVLGIAVGPRSCGLHLVAES